MWHFKRSPSPPHPVPQHIITSVIHVLPKPPPSSSSFEELHPTAQNGARHFPGAIPGETYQRTKILTLEGIAEGGANVKPFSHCARLATGTEEEEQEEKEGAEQGEKEQGSGKG